MYSNNNTAASALGKKGEDMVARYLKDNGYIILKQNWRDRFGEIDIIAENDDNIVFVEVKTRSENALVSGLEAVDSGKMHRIKNEAISFTKRLNTDLPPRIDVAEVTVKTDNNGKSVYSLNYIKNVY